MPAKTAPRTTERGSERKSTKATTTAKKVAPTDPVARAVENKGAVRFGTSSHEASKTPVVSRGATTTKTEDNVVVVTSLIRTPEDCVDKFLRGELDEQGLRDSLAKFGTNPEIQFANQPRLFERLDHGFARKLPDDLVNAAVIRRDDTESRLDVVNAKQKIRDEATKAAENDKTVEETRKRETADFRTDLEDKHLVPALEKQIEAKKDTSKR